MRLKTVKPKEELICKRCGHFLDDGSDDCLDYIKFDEDGEPYCGDCLEKIQVRQELDWENRMEESYV